MPKLNLVVLCARDADRLAGFYSTLGLRFQRHQHGAGPEHYAAEESGGVFEIYPARATMPPTHGLRLGFAVTNVQNTVDQLVGAGGSLVSAPRASAWGLRAVVQDLEGHKVELTEAPAGN